MNKSSRNGSGRGYNHNFSKQMVVVLGGECEKCHKKYSLIAHHKDYNCRNNVLSNMQILCQKCHMKIHRAGYFIHRIRKYEKIYGISFEGISKKYNIPYSRIYKLHKQKILVEFLKNPTNKLLRKPTKYIKIYGFTLQEMGNKFGITRERVRQLHCDGKLKNMLRGKNAL